MQPSCCRLCGYVSKRFLGFTRNDAVNERVLGKNFTEGKGGEKAVQDDGHVRTARLAFF